MRHAKRTGLKYQANIAETKDSKLKFYREFASSIQSEDEAIKSNLTPEQQTKYTDYKNELKQAEIEERVNRQLAELGSSVILTSDQKDKLFTIFSETEIRFDPIQAILGGQMPEEARINAELENKELMKGILTEQQIRMLLDQLAQQDQLLKKLNVGK